LNTKRNPFEAKKLHRHALLEGVAANREILRSLARGSVGLESCHNREILRLRLRFAQDDRGPSLIMGGVSCYRSERELLFTPPAGSLSVHIHFLL